MAFILGKPVRSVTVFPEVFDRLRGIPATLTVHVPNGDGSIPPHVFDSDLVVQRGLDMRQLLSARRLENAGIRCCNPVSSTVAVRNRALISQILVDAGLPVPITAYAAIWPEVLDLAQGRAVVVKAADGSAGRGVGVLVANTGSLPRRAPFAEPYVVQEYVRSDGRVHKLYVAGREVRGLVKETSTSQPPGRPVVPFTLNTELASMARLAGTALDLEIYGVDVLYGPDGPVIVDVNPFPGFRGVSEAPQLIADHLTAIVMGEEHDVRRQ